LLDCTIVYLFLTTRNNINNLTHYNILYQFMSSTAEDPRETLDSYLQTHANPCLYILTPCYGGMCYTSYTKSIMATVEMLKQYNIDVHVEFCNSDSLVSRARNNLIAKAMSDPLTTHILFIDADITWNPDDIIKLIISNKGLCGGVYPLKKYHWERMLKNPSGEPNYDVLSNWMEKKDKSIFKDILSDEELVQHKLLNYNLNYVSNKIEIKNNMAEVRHIATGFMMMKRTTIEKMMNAFQYTKYTDDIGFLKGEQNKYAYALFDCGVENDHYLSEDWMFCERWRKLGGTIHADVTINLIHTGQEQYNGCYLSTIMT